MVEFVVWDHVMGVRFSPPRPYKGNKMTCRGYDPKAVKIGKPVKCLAAKILDNHTRGDFIKSYVRIAETQVHVRSGRKDSSK